LSRSSQMRSGSTLPASPRHELSPAFGLTKPPAIWLNRREKAACRISQIISKRIVDRANRRYWRLNLIRSFLMSRTQVDVSKMERGCRNPAAAQCQTAGIWDPAPLPKPECQAKKQRLNFVSRLYLMLTAE